MSKQSLRKIGFALLSVGIASLATIIALNIIGHYVNPFVMGWFAPVHFVCFYSLLISFSCIPLLIITKPRTTDRPKNTANKSQPAFPVYDNYCPHCGAHRKEGCGFCSNCGKPF